MKQDINVLRAAEQFAPQAQKVFPEARIFLFGSYAKGCAKPYSDIDVAVVLDDFPAGSDANSIFKARLKLAELAENIDERIEPTLTTLQNKSGFVKNVIDTGIEVTPQNQLFPNRDLQRREKFFTA